MNRLLLALALLPLLSCQPIDPNGTDSGNALTLSVEGAGIEGQPAGPQAPPLAYNGSLIDEAWLGIREVRFVSCDGSREKTDFVGAHAVDLLQTTELGTTTVDGEELCGIRFEVDEGLASPIEERSILMTGVTEGGTPWQISSDLRETLRVDDGEGALMSDGEDFLVLLRFDLSLWLEEIDFDEGVVTDGVIVINDSINDVLLDQFEENFKASAELTRP